jgi:hypothetical protein
MSAGCECGGCSSGCRVEVRNLCGFMSAVAPVAMRKGVMDAVESDID